MSDMMFDSITEIEETIGAERNTAERSIAEKIGEGTSATTEEKIEEIGAN